jgi:hypothetical protein
MGKLPELFERYERQPILRALVQLIPFGAGSAVDTGLAVAAARHEEERLRTFFDELGKGKIELTVDVAKSEDFVHAFLATTTAARRTRQREKIRYLARLLRSTFSAEPPRSSDEYEEMLSIVEELSARELEILALLGSAERETRFRGDENDLQRANAIWPRFEILVREHLRLSPEEMEPMLVRLQRSGCYVEITGGYWDYKGGRGHLSSLYRRLEQLAGSIVESAP